jgi:hypothetical protein
VRHTIVMVMKAFKNCVVPLLLALALTLSAAASDSYNDLRGLIDRTQSDLRSASGLEHTKKQLNRYHDAQDILSKLDRRLSKGKFDKGALDHSINELKGVLDHNTLQSSGRDQLSRDLADLKAARDHR